MLAFYLAKYFCNAFSKYEDFKHSLCAATMVVTIEVEVDEL